MKKNDLELKKFINCIIDDYPTGCFWEIRLIKDKRVISKFFKNFKQISEFLNEKKEYSEMNQYLGILPRDKESGTAKDVICGNMVFIDLDSSKAIEDAEKIYTTLIEKGLRPALMCNSGNGVHVYFKLKDLLKIETWSRMQKGMLTFFQKHFGEYKPDAVIIDSPRIMRIIGSVNQKGKEPKLSKIIYEDYTQYTLSDLKKILKGYFEREKKTIKTLLRSENKKNLPLDIQGIIKTGIEKSERHVHAFMIIKECFKNGYSKEETISQVLEYNANCKPPKDEQEIIAHVENLWEKPEKYLSSSEISRRDAPFKNLGYCTGHLRNFDAVRNLLKLRGAEYAILRKAVWYFFNSIPIRTYNCALGEISSDGRFHLGIPMPSGSGKKNIIDAIVKLASALGLEYSSPTSYHPEQLIGKTIKKKTRAGEEFNKIIGHFGDDIVIFNEAKELLDSEEINYKECRKYCATALDPYPTNPVEKRMVDVPKEHKMRYSPYFNLCMLFQPFRFPEDIVLSGLLRRFLIPYAKLKQGDMIEHYKERAESKNGDGFKDIETITDGINEVREMVKNTNFVFGLNSDAIKRFEDLHLKLVYQGMMHSKKAKNYMKIIDYALQDNFLKLVFIQASSRGRTMGNVEDVETGYMDMVEFLQHTLDFVSEKVIGYLDYNESWGGVTEENLSCLEWLEEQGAISENTSNVTIESYLEKVEDLCKLGSEGARKRYETHRKKGWVKGKRVGQYSSKVWLTLKPDKEKEFLPEYEGSLSEDYFKLVEKYGGKEE